MSCSVQVLFGGALIILGAIVLNIIMFCTFSNFVALVNRKCPDRVRDLELDYGEGGESNLKVMGIFARRDYLKWNDAEVSRLGDRVRLQGAISMLSAVAAVAFFPLQSWIEKTFFC